MRCELLHPRSWTVLQHNCQFLHQERRDGLKPLFKGVGFSSEKRELLTFLVDVSQALVRLLLSEFKLMK